MKLRLLGVMLAVIGLLSPLLLTTGNAEYTTPIVWSNKKSYDPSETVYLYGYGYNPFSPVTITIIRPDLVEDTVQTSTDEFGYFAAQYLLDGIHGTFNVEATDGVNVATTTFGNHLYLQACWNDAPCCLYIHSKAGGLSKTKSYYVKYFDPAGIERRQSPTYTGVNVFEDELAVLPTFPNILGTWTIRLYENGVRKKTVTVYINKMVWTTDSTYNNVVTSFAQGQTIYFKAIGLLSNKYHRFQLEMPGGTRFYVGDWFTGETSKTGSYTLSTAAQIGDWKLHVRKADSASGTNEAHYVDCCFIVTEAPQPQQYYLNVEIDPPGIGTILGEGWYYEFTNVNLTASDLFPGATGVRYRFDYWDVDGAPHGTGVEEITVYMDANHTATAHYITQYYLNLTTNPLGVTTPAGIDWYDAGTSAPIFAPEYVGIVPSESRYRFDGWTTADMSEIANASAISTTVFMDKAKTVTANYVTQYLVTFSQTGLDDTANSDVVTVDSFARSYDDLPYTIWVDKNSVVTYSYYSIITSSTTGKRFSLVDVTGPSSPITVTTAVTVTGNYKTQYYLTMSTNFGTVSPGNGWHDAGSVVSISATPPSTVSGERYVWNGWAGTGTGSYTGPNNSATITMNAPITQTASWTHQYYFTVTSPYDSPTPTSAWFDAGTSITASVTSPWAGPAGTRYVCTGWTGTGSVPSSGSTASVAFTINAPSIITWNWKTQYYLTLTTNPGSVTTPSGEDWYDAGTYAPISTADLVDIVSGSSRYKFNGWTTADMPEIADPSSPSTTVFMDKPKTVAANYKAQYYLTITHTSGGVTDPASSGWYDAGITASVTAIPDPDYVLNRWELDGSPVGSTNPYNVLMNSAHTLHAVFEYSSPPTYYLTVKTDPLGITSIPGQGWYDEGINVTLTAPNYVNVSAGTRYRFAYWDVDGTPRSVGVNPITVTMNANHTATAHYILQYYLTVTSARNTPTPTSRWYDAGDSITASVTSPWAGPTGTRYVCTGWTGTGSVPASGTATSVAFTMNAPSSITWNWKTQHYLTVETAPSGIVTIPGEGWYDKSATVPLTAPDVTGYEFRYWDVDGTPQGDGVKTISVTMSMPRTATARYHSPTVGGSATTIELHLTPTWMGINSILAGAFCIAAFYAKKRRKIV